MCWMLGYIGAPVLPVHLVVRPVNALLNQTTDAQLLAMLNLAGFGLAAWNDDLHDAHLPLTFHFTNVAVFDANLHALAARLKVCSLVAHLRGVPLDGSATITQQSLHPFQLAGSPLVLAIMTISRSSALCAPPCGRTSSPTFCGA